MKVKNISGGPLDVPLLDREVADGEVIDVPDTQPDGSLLAWSPAHFQVVADKAAPKADSGKAAS